MSFGGLRKRGRARDVDILFYTLTSLSATGGSCHGVVLCWTRAADASWLGLLLLLRLALSLLSFSKVRELLVSIQFLLR